MKYARSNLILPILKCRTFQLYNVNVSLGRNIQDRIQCNSIPICKPSSIPCTPVRRGKKYARSNITLFYLSVNIELFNYTFFSLERNIHLRSETMLFCLS